MKWDHENGNIFRFSLTKDTQVGFEYLLKEEVTEKIKISNLTVQFSFFRF